MPRINRSHTFYVELPDWLKTSSIPDAKMSISVTMTVPKELEDRAQKTMVTVLDEAHDVFEDKMKKAIKKL